MIQTENVGPSLINWICPKYLTQLLCALWLNQEFVRYLPRPGTEHWSPRLESGIITTILPWRPSLHPYILPLVWGLMFLIVCHFEASPTGLESGIITTLLPRLHEAWPSSSSLSPLLWDPIFLFGCHFEISSVAGVEIFWIRVRQHNHFTSAVTWSLVFIIITIFPFYEASCLCSGTIFRYRLLVSLWLESSVITTKTFIDLGISLHPY